MDDEEPRYEVIWSESAVADLESIGLFIATDNPEATRVVRMIFEHIDLLTRFPFIGPAYPLGSSGSLREVVVRRIYRIFYSVDESRRVVDVLRVWHGARGQPELPLG